MESVARGEKRTYGERLEYHVSINVQGKKKALQDCDNMRLHTYIIQTNY